MASLVTSFLSTKFTRLPIQKGSPRLSFLAPLLIVMFTSLLFWLTYTFQHSCEPLILIGRLPKACYIASVTIQSNHLKPLDRGDQEQLKAEVELKNLPKDYKTKSMKAVEWKSSHPEFASINSKGILTARAQGETQIIATSRENPHKRAMIKVKVEPNSIITDITFIPKKLIGYKGEQFSADNDFSIYIQGERNFDKTFKYESGDSQIVYVDSERQKIQLKSPGEASITATSTVNPKQKASMKITVLPPQIEAIQIEPSSLKLQPSKTKKLQVTFEGKGRFDQTVIWSSDNENIAEVDSDGIVIGKQDGNTLIWGVSKSDTNITSRVSVNVQEDGEGGIISKGVPIVAGGVCLVATTAMLVPPPLSVPICGAFGGSFYWLLNH